MRRDAEAGSAFYIILLGVFLFAALMFTFSKSAKQGTGNLTRKQAELAADDILSFAQQLQHGIDKVYAGDCSENEISFEQNAIPGYANASAPADKHCHVFDANGGSVAYRTVPQNANDGSPWVFTGANNVAASTFGTAAPDLVMMVAGLDDAVCAQINHVLKITGATAEAATVSTTKFAGAFAATDQVGSGDGRRAECTTGAINRFYSVLMER